MTDKELIQSLRICYKRSNCIGCELDGKCGGINRILTDAADRPEALLAENERLRDSARRLWAGMPRYCGDLHGFAMHADELPGTGEVE